MWSDTATATTTRGSSSSTPRPRTGPGTSRPAPTTGTASSATSPTSTTTSRRSRRRCSTCCASGSTSGSTASASTPCPTSSSARAPTARTCPRRTPSCKRVRADDRREYPDRVLLAEANQWPEDVVEYFGDGDECHMAFHFPVMPRMFMALRREEAAPIVEILEQTPRDPRQLPVGAVPAQPRRADARDGHRRGARLHVRRVRPGPADEAQRRHPPAPRAAARQRPRRDRAADAIMFSLPGSPVLYYGDEIAMGDNVYLGDRDGVRTPMQWTGDRNGGFSRADFAQLYAPPLMDPVYGYQAVNVEAQLRTPTSLLRWLRRFIALRKEHPVFGLGSYEALTPSNPTDLRPHPPLRGRHRAVRAQPRAHRAGRRARPLRVRGPLPGRDVRAHALPADRRAALPADAARRAASSGSC